MHLHQLFDHGQPNTQPSFGPGRRAVALGEELKHRGQLLRDAHAGIFHADNEIALLAPGREPDIPAVVAVLGGIIEQVDHDLLRRRGSAFTQRFPRSIAIWSAILPLLDGRRFDRLGGTFQDRGHIDDIAAKLDLAEADA